MITKVCTKCGEEKELSEFYKSSQIKSGYRPQCKKCTSKTQKLWRKNNPERISKTQKLWRRINREKCGEISRKSKQKRKIEKPGELEEYMHKYNKQYRKNNKERCLKYNREWRRTNPEKNSKIKKRWKQANPESVKASHTRRKRELGFNPLNEKFLGSVGHHINRDDVVFIPEQLHKSIIHNQGDKESMNEINTLALEYLITEVEDE